MVFDIVIVYINLLCVENLCVVQCNNLSIMCVNFEFVEVCCEVGVVLSSEILCWQSEVVNVKQVFIGVDVDVCIVVVEFN